MITHVWVDASPELADNEVAKTFYRCAHCGTCFLTTDKQADKPTDEYCLMASEGTIGACPAFASTLGRWAS